MPSTPASSASRRRWISGPSSACARRLTRTRSAAASLAASGHAQDPQPAFGVDVGTPAAVDAAHAAAQQRGMRIRYGPTDEPWGIRRFFVEDPGGTLVSVLAHVG